MGQSNSKRGTKGTSGSNKKKASRNDFVFELNMKNILPIECHLYLLEGILEEFPQFFEHENHEALLTAWALVIDVAEDPRFLNCLGIGVPEDDPSIGTIIFGTSQT
jgi:hypothetical protein